MRHQWEAGRSPYHHCGSPCEITVPDTTRRCEEYVALGRPAPGPDAEHGWDRCPPGSHHTSRERSVCSTVMLQPTSNEYFVSLWETTKPMGINQFNPNQLTKANGTMRHSSALRVQSPIANWTVNWLPLSTNHPAPTGTAGDYGYIQPLTPGVLLSLRNGITGTLYTRGTDPGGTVGNTETIPFILWHEGQWTFESIGSSAKSLARTMVNVVQVSQLPKAEAGFLIVSSTRKNAGPSTSLTWYQHPYIISFSSSTHGPTNLQASLFMADSWRTWHLHP